MARLTLAHLVAACVESRAGALAPVAGTIVVTEAMQSAYDRSDDLTAQLVAKGQAAGVMREDVTARDVMALIVQLSRRDEFDESESDRNARERVIAIALADLRPGQHTTLPGLPPGDDLFTEHWVDTEWIM